MRVKSGGTLHTTTFHLDDGTDISGDLRVVEMNTEWEGEVLYVTVKCAMVNLG